MTTRKVQDFTDIGNIAKGDKLLGERVDGTTVRITYQNTPILYDVNGNASLSFTATAAATNYATITNNSIGVVQYGVGGAATDCSLWLVAKGVGNFSMLSQAPSNQYQFTCGTGFQHNTIFNFANTNNTRIVTWPDAAGTVVLTPGSTSVTTLGTVTTGTWNASIIGMTYGGTGANLTPSNGGIIYSNASTMAVLSGTATANKMLLSGSTAAPTWSTSTIPTSSGASGKWLKSDGTNYISSTATLAEPTGGTGRYLVNVSNTAWSTSNFAIPAFIGTSGQHYKSNGTDVVFTTSTFPDGGTNRKMIVGNGTNYVESTETWAVPGTANNILKSDGTNWTSAASTGTGNNVLATSPTISTPVINGFTDGSSAAAGVVGEVLSSAATAVAITSTTITQIGSISLTAGDWQLWGLAAAIPGTGTVSQLLANIGPTSASIPTPTTAATAGGVYWPFTAGATTNVYGGIPPTTIRISATTTYYMNGFIIYGGGTCTATSIILARRLR